MRRNCRNCVSLVSYASGLGEVECKILGTLQVDDVSDFLQRDNNCPEFVAEVIPDYLDNDVRKRYLTVIDKLEYSTVIGQSIKKYRKIPSGSHFWTHRGMAMLMLSDDDLPAFESDDKFREYRYSNHMFADLLVPIDSKLINPIIFWLAETNQPGCNYFISKDPITHHILQLGKAYGLEALLSCLAQALRFEGVRIECRWFIQQIEGITRKTLQEIDPSCLEVFY